VCRLSLFVIGDGFDAGRLLRLPEVVPICSSASGWLARYLRRLLDRQRHEQQRQKKHPRKPDANEQSGAKSHEIQNAPPSD
jgi:hypothetical protein